MLIELVKQHRFIDLMSTSPFFFDKTFSDCMFVVAMTKQNNLEINLKNPKTNLVIWKINKMNKQEVILVNYKELGTITNGQRVMIFAAFKKLVSKQFKAILIPNEHDECFSEILKMVNEKEIVCFSNKHYIYIPC